MSGFLGTGIWGCEVADWFLGVLGLWSLCMRKKEIGGQNRILQSY